MSNILLAYLVISILPLVFFKYSCFSKTLSLGGAFVLGAYSLVYFALNLNESFMVVLPKNLLFNTSFITNPLSNFFLIIIFLITSLGALFSIDYVKAKNINPAAFGSLYNFFTLSMILVVVSDNVFSFVLLWEVMTIVSALFLYFNDNSEDILKAVLVYIGVAQLGAFLMIIALLIMSSGANSIYFVDFKNLNLSPALNYLSFLLLFLGFGSKAGIFPLHVWLPFAYKIAPHNSVALMSAVMGKLAIFGIIKFTLCLEITTSIAYTVMAFGMFSAVFGIFYAVVENDYKKIIGFSSIENIGIILIALGVGLFGIAKNLEIIAIMGFLAALFHSLNHSVFKSLLFLSSGALSCSVNTSDINKMGGLHKKMPLISYSFLVGILAISTIPPLSGFMSEWILFKSIILSATFKDVANRFMMVLALLSLGVAGSFAIMTFIKLYGSVFLGLNRDEEIYNNAKEGSMFMAIPLIVLAGISVFCGIFAYIIIPTIVNICSGLINTSITPPSLVSTPLISIMLITLFILVIIALIIFRTNNTPARLTKPWAAGYKYDNKMQVGSTPFTGDLRRILSFVYRHETTFKDDGYFTKSTYKTTIKEIWWEKVYEPIINLNIRAAKILSLLQNGRTNIYALYITLYLCIMFVVSYYLL